MRRLLLYTIILLVSGMALAQTAVQADQFFTTQNYTAAKDAYANLLKRDTRNALYLYRYARCAYETGDADEAIAYFLKAGTRYSLRDFYLAEAYAQTYQFDEALEAYERYQNTIDTTHERYGYVVAQMEYAQKGSRYMRRVADVAFVDSVIVPKATFLAAYPLAAEAGSLTDSVGKVSYTNQRNDRRIVTDSVDGHIGLLSCQRLLDGWSACDTLRIDVAGNVNYPFVLADGLTLYFAADDPSGLGGYDLYFTRYNAEQNTYLTPENIGFPFNSSGNDYMLAIDEIHHLGYFATDRFTGDSLVAIYTFVPNTETRVVRNVDSVYLRELAQLKRYKVAEKVTIVDTPQEAEAEEIAEDEQFFFVLNDMVVYRNLDDFTNKEAREKMEEYVHVTKELKRRTDELQAARAKYAQADEAEQQELAKVILAAEKEIPMMKKAVERLAQEVRGKESGVKSQESR